MANDCRGQIVVAADWVTRPFGRVVAGVTSVFTSSLPNKTRRSDSNSSQFEKGAFA